MIPLNYDRFLEQIRKWEWLVKGSLAKTLQLKKSTSSSKLIAIVSVINLKDGTYAAIATLNAPDAQGIVKDAYVTPRYMLLNDLERTIAGDFEAYFTGYTNNKQIKEIYRKYKIN